VAESSWPSAHLVAAAQHGDAESLAALVSGSHPHVQRFALSLCGTRQDAEDAAQEALIILYTKVGTLRATAALASWMFRIVRNECVRRSRSVFRVAAAVPEIALPGFEDDVLRRLEAERVAAAVAALPEDQRRVLIMRDIQGYSGRAAADALGLSVVAAKSRLHRARAAVRAALEVEGAAGVRGGGDCGER